MLTQDYGHLSQFAMTRRRKDNGSDVIGVLLLIFLVVAIISFGAALLYLPLRKYRNKTPGKMIAIAGIVTIIAGAGLALALSGNTGNTSDSGVPWPAWLLPSLGLVLWIVGLAKASSYQARLSAARQEIDAAISAQRPMQAQLAETVQAICHQRRLQASDVQSVLSYATREHTLKTIENSRILPAASPPGDVFLKPDETCHASFIGVSLHEDVFANQRSTVGGALYLRLGRGVTLRPTAYSSSSMPVAELKKVDDGSLVVTSRRVIFQGQRFRLDVPIAKIEGLSPYRDGFQIHTAGKTRRQIFSMSPVEVRVAVIVISRLVAEDAQGSETVPVQLPLSYLT